MNRRWEPDEPGAWRNLEPEIRVPLTAHVQRELAARAISGAMVYFVVCLALALATSYYQDQPVLLGATSVAMLLLGVLRIASARKVKADPVNASPMIRQLFLSATYATFAIWGLFCGWTLHLYPG